MDDVADPEIDAASADARASLAAVWQKRGSLELQVASTFARVSIELLEFGADPAVYAIVSQAVRDEVHHAQISVELAARYRGGAPIWPKPEHTNVPPFSPTQGAMHATLYVIGMCCLNETSACSILEASLGQAKSPLVRAALATILSDEVEHARAGWAHLASRFVTPEMKGALPKWLVHIHAAGLRDLVEEDAPLPGEAYPAHGILSRRRRQEIVHATLVDVMVPGYRRAGIDASPLEAWAREAFKAVE